MILEPDLFQRFVGFEEELLVEFFDAFEKSRIVFRVHHESGFKTSYDCTGQSERLARLSAWLCVSIVVKNRALRSSRVIDNIKSPGNPMSQTNAKEPIT